MMLKWLPLGDSALIAECASPAASAVQIREGLPLMGCDVVSSFDHLSVHLPSPLDLPQVEEWLQGFVFKKGELKPRLREVPVWYHPEWIAELSGEGGMTADTIMEELGAVEFGVAALGFSPGFPYFSGLPAAFHLPRKVTPVRLPAGTVAIAAHQAGIYPNESFGGWHPLGVTGLNLFDPYADELTFFQPGDRVKFCALDEEPTRERSSGSWFFEGEAVVVVESAGPATSVQAGPRAGHRHLGVTPGGFTDPEMAHALNLLLGQARDVPVLEFALQGPVLRFLKPCQVAFLGPSHEQAGSVMEVKAGQVLDLRSVPMQSSFGMLTIAGGFVGEDLLGSVATDVRGKFGGKLVSGGDELISNPVGEIKASRARIQWPLFDMAKTVIRILPGAQGGWFSDTLEGSDFRKSARFDRTAARLEGAPLRCVMTEELTSAPVVAGAIQVPPDGMPTVLLAECQTIGGYPIIAHVISADLSKFARAKPGTPLVFQMVTLAEARAAMRQREQELAFLRTGLKLSER